MRLQLHKIPSTQELCHGGTWERNTDHVSTGGTWVVSQCWDHSMHPQQGLPKEASLEMLKYPDTLTVQSPEQPDLVRLVLSRRLPEVSSIRNDSVLQLHDLMRCGVNHHPLLWEGSLAASRGGKVWSNPLWSGHCWEQDWEQMCPAEQLQIRSRQSEWNVAGC